MEIIREKIDLLISVVVVTYNSEETILETLESIYNQNYKKIELVVTDDYSQDRTIKKIQEWLDTKGKRFYNVKIIQNTENMGITKNLNNGLKNASGEYIKPLAGDDILLETCLRDSLNYCLTKNYEIIYSKVIPFTTIPDKEYEKKLYLMERQTDCFFYLSKEEQFNKLLFSFPITTVGLFFSSNLIKEMEYFDEVYGMMEDYPFAFKVVSKGIKLNLLPKEEIKYRVRSKEENLKIRETPRIKKHQEALKKFRAEVIIPELVKRKMYLKYYNLRVRMIEETLCNNKNSVIKNLGKIFGFLSTEKIKTKYLYLKSKSY